MASRAYPGANVTAEYAYDNLGRLTDIEAGTLVDFRYTYAVHTNNIERKTFEHRPQSPYNQYGYDNIDRLTGVDYLNSPVGGSAHAVVNRAQIIFAARVIKRV